MAEKNCDSKGRFRSVTIGFRMSPEEADLLNRLVQVSGLTKQDYMIDRALQRDVVVKGSPKLFIGLKREIIRLCEELERIGSTCEITDEQLMVLNQITDILSAIKN